jgi:NAD(P)-dependent dehydrogenase (short-subunit alcohol dehydrogenase family)
MNNSKKTAIIVSASSDIGAAMAQRWLSYGWSVHGTYRTYSNKVDDLINKGCPLIHCDLSDQMSVKEACLHLRSACDKWDVLVLAQGSQEPVGSFLKCDFDQWEESIKSNFSSQLRMVHKLMAHRRAESAERPCVLFFAGGGINNATVNYSAYTISKIALIKMCELLDAEILDTMFVIVGPGWVKTKIHEATLVAKEKAGSNYKKTLDKLNGEECTSMEDVLNCCDWLISSPREVVSGRNFSVVFDKWGTEELTNMLKEDPNICKLRRYGNNIMVKQKKEAV